VNKRTENERATAPMPIRASGGEQTNRTKVSPLWKRPRADRNDAVCRKCAAQDGSGRACKEACKHRNHAGNTQKEGTASRILAAKGRRNETVFLVNIILLIGRDVKRNLRPFRGFLWKLHGLVLIRVSGSFLSVFFRLARGCASRKKPARSERGIGTCTVDFVWLVLVFGAPASAALRDVLS
jgi:hypothetical protein